MSEFGQIFKLITGVDVAEAVEAHGDPEKESALLARVFENTKPKDVFREACEELLADRKEKESNG